jgi:hypothetical protein
MSPRDRLEAVLALGGPAVAKLEKRRAELRAKRTELGREAKRAAAVHAGMPVFPTAPADPVSVSELTADLQRVRAEEDRVARLYEQKRRAASTREACEANARRLEGEAAAAFAEASRKVEEAKAALRNAATVAEEETEINRQIDAAKPDALPGAAAKIAAQIDAAQDLNQQVNANRAAQNASATAALAEAHLGQTDHELEQLDGQRRILISQALRAVPCLDLGPDGVLLAGLPFEQAATSEQLRAALGIGIAANPELRLILIREGSLLDADALAEVARVAEAHDVQVLIERVGDLGAGVGVVIEDGSVAEEPAS